MNLFICNRIDNRNEDIYILTPNLPFGIYNDKYKLHYYKYNPKKSINLEKTLILSQNEDRKKNINNNNEESDELQIIDYPYKSQQPHNGLNESFFYNSKITNSFIDNNSGVYSCLNLNNNDGKYFGNKKAKDKNRKKKSFSFLSNSNMNRNYNESMHSDLNLEDTIKGEDNINISILKNENFNKYMNMNLKKQKMKLKNFENNIYSNSKTKSIPYYYKNNLINKNRLNMSKIENNSKIKKKLKMNEPSKKLSNKKRIKNTISQKKENIKPRIILNTSKNYKSNKKQNINNHINLRTNYKNYYNSSENNIFNYKNKSPISSRLHKTFSDNNIYNYDQRPKEIDDNKRYINDSKLIIEQIKKKIKKKMPNDNSKKGGKLLGIKKK